MTKMETARTGADFVGGLRRGSALLVVLVFSLLVLIAVYIMLT
jgi:hypothetical protein